MTRARLIALSVMFVLGCGWETAARSDTLWLVVAASDKTLVPVLTTAEKLRGDWPAATLVATADCSDGPTDFFLLAAVLAQSKAEAEKTLATLRRTVPDAYLKACDARAGSRLAMDVPLVDASIWKVPADAVNWTDGDRISELLHLGAEDYLIVRRVYDPQDDSPLEGRRQQILFFQGDAAQAALLNGRCWDFGGVVYAPPLLAFHCASQAAGDHILHTSEVYRLQPPQQVYTRAACRNPRLLKDGRLRCEAESVNSEGELSLTAVEQVLPRAE